MRQNDVSLYLQKPWSMCCFTKPRVVIPKLGRVDASGRWYSFSFTTFACGPHKSFFHLAPFLCMICKCLIVSMFEIASDSRVSKSVLSPTFEAAELFMAKNCSLKILICHKQHDYKNYTEKLNFDACQGTVTVIRFSNNEFFYSVRIAERNSFRFVSNIEISFGDTN